jgi:hypothetical protein
MSSFRTYVCDVCGTEEKERDAFRPGHLPYHWHLVAYGSRGSGDRPDFDDCRKEAAVTIVCSNACGARLFRAVGLIEADGSRALELEQALKLAG